MDKKYICKYCGKEYNSPRKLGGHVSRCKNNPNAKILAKEIGLKNTEHANFNIYDILCPICGKYKQVKLSLNSYNKGKYAKTCSSNCAHILTNLNTNINEKNKNISTSILNRYKNYKYRIKKCLNCGKEFSTKVRKSSIYCSDECMKLSKFKKLSESAKNRNFGGYVENSIKKHHHGNYNGLHYDSSWELAYIVYCLDHNIEIKRCNEIRYYEINGIKKKYFPDFIVENQIIEIKGYFNKISQIKAELNPDIIILMKNDMKPYITYALETYGNNYWETLK